jgi:Transmembrane protein 43
MIERGAAIASQSKTSDTTGRFVAGFGQLEAARPRVVSGVWAMSNTFTETTQTSWFTRIKNSFGGAVVGLILIVGMVVLLFWNEGRAVQTARSLAEGAGAVVSVGADSVDQGNEGKLIHVSGPVTTDATPSDPDFGVQAQGIRLVREVEMYQWKEEQHSETQKKLGGGEETVTTYSYSKTWDTSYNDSGRFKQPSGHENPSMEVHGENFQVPNASLGAFSLDEPVLSQIGGDKALPLKPDQRDAIQAAYAGTKKLSVIDGAIYLGWNPSSPVVGDYRIKYELAPLGTISVIGQQSGSGFVSYQTDAGDRLLMVDNGNVPADQMFREAENANKILTWILRGVGLLVLGIGFALFMSPMAVLADVIPFLGSLVRMGTGLIAFFLAIVVGTITIAIAWFYYRPLLGIGILVIGALVAAGILYLGRSRRQAAVSAPGASPTPTAPA